MFAHSISKRPFISHFAHQVDDANDHRQLVLRDIEGQGRGHCDVIDLERAALCFAVERAKGKELDLSALSSEQHGVSQCIAVHRVVALDRRVCFTASDAAGLAHDQCTSKSGMMHS